MDNGQELLLGLAPSTRLCLRVQQGLYVTLVTDARAYFTQAKLWQTVDLSILSEHWIY